jgi:chaperonin GroES
MAAALPKLAVEIHPLGDRVVVLPMEAEQVTASGIVIPDTAKDKKPQEGTVIALGKGDMMTSEGKVSNPHDFLKVGDKVLYGKYAGDEIEVKDKDGKLHELKILRLDSVLGVVKK